MSIPNPSKPSLHSASRITNDALVTLAENEHSETRSASGTIPEAKRSRARAVPNPSNPSKASKHLFFTLYSYFDSMHTKKKRR